MSIKMDYKQKAEIMKKFTPLLLEDLDEEHQKEIIMEIKKERPLLFEQYENGERIQIGVYIDNKDYSVF